MGSREKMEVTQGKHLLRRHHVLLGPRQYNLVYLWEHADLNVCSQKPSPREEKKMRKKKGRQTRSKFPRIPASASWITLPVRACHCTYFHQKEAAFWCLVRRKKKNRRVPGTRHQVSKAQMFRKETMATKTMLVKFSCCHLKDSCWIISWEYCFTWKASLNFKRLSGANYELNFFYRSLQRISQTL